MVIWYLDTLWKYPHHVINQHIHQLTYLSFFFFFWWKHLVLLSYKFQLDNTKLTTVTMFYIRSSEPMHLRARSLYPFINLLFIPISRPCQLLFHILRVWLFFFFYFSRNTMQYICLFLSGLFHWNNALKAHPYY